MFDSIKKHTALYINTQYYLSMKKRKTLLAFKKVKIAPINYIATIRGGDSETVESGYPHCNELETENPANCNSFTNGATNLTETIQTVAETCNTCKSVDICNTILTRTGTI